MTTPSGLNFYIPGALLFLVACAKLPALLRNPRDELLRSVWVLLVVSTAVFWCCAVPSIAAFNRLTGVPNAAAPLVYTLLTVFSGSNISLIIRWSSGPEDAQRADRWSKRCYIATAVVIIAINVLFLLGDASVERLRDLDTYYASTPFIREMILLYLAAHTIAAVTMTILCWRWAREVHGELRVGLLLIVGGYLLNLAYDALKFAAIGAHWTGRNWDVLSVTYAASLASFSALLIGAGFILPLLSQRFMHFWTPWRRYYQLRPLWRELREASQHSMGIGSSVRTPIEIRLVRVEADIHDGILTVSPHIDARIRSQALHAASKSSRSDDEAAATADAAALAHAVSAWRQHQAAATDPEERVNDHNETLGSAHTPIGLVRMSIALSSDVVQRFRHQAAVAESSTQ
ncbi:MULTISPECIES: MAB_1171c family putative transporter [unclassified Streptomyces]|uniref:MAB_1171c family putative transporter n=1 Tax=unclassified Streptomyces TaxID=2593676 RepID=UPI002E2BEA49|nr:MAB_1171c family putative transporter [Streptomyces sp. NBC_00273]